MRLLTPDELAAIRERAEGVEAEVLFCDANGIPLKRWSKKPSYLDVLSLLEHIRVTEREVAIWRDVASDATHTEIDVALWLAVGGMHETLRQLRDGDWHSWDMVLGPLTMLIVAEKRGWVECDEEHYRLTRSGKRQLKCWDALQADLLVEQGEATP